MPRPAFAPPAIRTDHSNAFGNNTMRVRVPETLQLTIDTNPGYTPQIKDALARLRDSIAADGPIPLLALPAPDYDDWAEMVAPYAHDSWHNTEWFFAEVYSYRLIMEAVRWWETGRDPFLPIKLEEESGSNLWDMVAEALEQHGPDLPADERIIRLLHGALWGNRIDLSFKWALERGTDVSHDDLLVDHSAAVAKHLTSNRGTVHLVADNYGREFAMDLVLVDGLLDTTADTVMLHLKFHPTFVSDATIPDLQRWLSLAKTQTPDAARLGDRLQTAIEEGRLRLIADPFWNSSYFLWDMPPRLRRLFEQASLVIIKGDLNYRRAIGDAIWPGTVSLRDVFSYLPAPVVALRALKSDTIAGLPDDLMAQLDQIDPDWHWNGKRGLLQSTLG